MCRSVIKSKRSESEMEFIHTARQLQIHTIKKCTGFPKRYTFYVSQPLAACATRIHEYVKCANSIYPTNQQDAQIRREYLIRANAELNSKTEKARMLTSRWKNLIERCIQLVAKLA